LGVFDEATISQWESMPKPAIVASLTDDHVRQIVETQCRYLEDIGEIDGKPGQTFFEIIAGIYPSLAAAKQDLLRLDDLLSQLDNFPLKNVADMRTKLKSGLLIKTQRNRQRILDDTKYDPRLKIEVVQHATVGPYSQGCQIIFDTELFYIFWTRLLSRAKSAGQQRWYYTLVDTSGWETDLVG
jgi:hypothetical protein